MKNIRFNSNSFLYDHPYGELFFDKLNLLLVEIIWKIQTFYTDEQNAGDKINKKFQKKQDNDPEVCVQARKELLSKLKLVDPAFHRNLFQEEDSVCYKATDIYSFHAKLYREFSLSEKDLLIQIRKRIQHSIVKWCLLFENVMGEIWEDEELLIQNTELSFSKSPELNYRKHVVFCDGFIGDGKTQYIKKYQSADYEGSQFFRTKINPYKDKNNNTINYLPTKYFLIPIFYDLFKCFLLESPSKDTIYFSRFLPCNSSFLWNTNHVMNENYNEIQELLKKPNVINHERIRGEVGQVADSFIIQFMYLMGVESFQVKYFFGPPKNFLLHDERDYEKYIYDLVVRRKDEKLELVIHSDFIISHHLRNIIKLSRFFGNYLCNIPDVIKVKGIPIYCPNSSFKLHKDEIIHKKFNFEPLYSFTDFSTSFRETNTSVTEPHSVQRFDGYIEARSINNSSNPLLHIRSITDQSIFIYHRYLIDPCYDGLYFFNDTITFTLHDYSYVIPKKEWNSPNFEDLKSYEPKCFFKDENKLDIAAFISNNAKNAGFDIILSSPIQFKKGIAKQIDIPAFSHYLRSLENWYVRSKYINTIEIYISQNKLYGVSSEDVEVSDFLQFVPLYKLDGIDESETIKNLETFYHIYVDFPKEVLEQNKLNEKILDFRIKKRKLVDTDSYNA